MPFPDICLEGVECVIHLAHDFNGEAGAEITIKSTVKLVNQIRQAGVKKQIFFSSYSAGPHSKSLYGITKFRLEKAFKSYHDIVIVRPGLVLGHGGIVKKISQIVNSFPIIPLPNGGEGLVPVISIRKLTKIILNIAFNKSFNQLNLFESELISLRSLVKNLSGNKNVLIISFPRIIFYLFIKLINILRINNSITLDNLDGFFANQLAEHKSDLRFFNE